MWNKCEKVCSSSPPPAPQIEVIQKSIEPFATLWRFCSEAMRSLPEWMDGPFPEIDPEVVANECDKWWRGTAKLAKTLTGGPLEVFTQVRGGGGEGVVQPSCPRH